jgi:hypothetical protein
LAVSTAASKCTFSNLARHILTYILWAICPLQIPLVNGSIWALILLWVT